MNHVKILSGVSGCGKSTLASKLFAPDKGAYETIISADDFFMVNDEYKFDPSKLSEAHGACFRDFIRYLNEDYCGLIVVDNTNTTAVEIAPYILGAQAYGWDVEIITLTCQTDDDVKVCAARNSHGVPFATVMAQHRRLCDRQLMPWWKNTNQRIKG